MPRRTTIGLGPFTGIDRTRKGSAADKDSLFDALNCDLLPGGSVKARDALVKFKEVDSRSVGLFAAGGSLRTLVPAGHGVELLAPPDITYDPIGNSVSAPLPLDEIVALRAIETFGADEIIGPFPYVIIETKSGQFRHHFVNNRPLVGGGPVKTNVATGFESGATLVKTQGKLWCPDRTQGVLHFSSTLQGPTVWREEQAPADAGFISVLEHARGDTQIRGVAYFNDNLTVFFKNSVQFWVVDPDPALIAFRTAYTGPGTDQFESVANVISDLYYFSEGGFRSLTTQTVTGEQREPDLGTRVAELTKEFETIGSDNTIAFWSEARRQYLCFFRQPEKGMTTVFAYTMSLVLGTAGWTRWELPIVVDYVAELDGQLYVRAEDIVYIFKAEVEKDCISQAGGTDIVAKCQTQFSHQSTRQQIKIWQYVHLDQEGIASMKYLTNPNNRDIAVQGAQNFEGSTDAYRRLPIANQSTSLAIDFETNKRWRLEQITLEYDILTGAG